MKVLFIDGYNLFHRARFGFGVGDYNIVYTFFRSFRSMIEQMNADKIIVVLEGNPKFRHELYPEYKINRKVSADNAQKIEELDDFRRQKDIIIRLLSHLPIELVYHPDYEGDDLIGKLVNSTYSNDTCVIVTGDTDFIQLLDEERDVSIWNPIKKSWVSKPSYDYVLWKSIVGDTADNIKGVHRVGHKTAEKVLSMTSDKVTAWINESPERLSTVTRNQTLIKFADVPLEGVISLSNEVSLEEIRKSFESMGFESMLSDKAWNKFAGTFNI